MLVTRCTCACVPAEVAKYGHQQLAPSRSMLDLEKAFDALMLAAPTKGEWLQHSVAQ